MSCGTEKKWWSTVTWADACSCSRPTGHTLSPRQNQHPARAVFGKCCKLISGRISAPFSTSPVKLWLPTALPSHNNRQYLLGKTRDQKKGTQTYKKYFKRNVWQMKEWRGRGKCIEEQTAYFKTFIKKKVQPERKNSSMTYFMFQIWILFNPSTDHQRETFNSSAFPYNESGWIPRTVKLQKKQKHKSFYMICGGHPLNSFASFIWAKKIKSLKIVFDRHGLLLFYEKGNSLIMASGWVNIDKIPIDGLTILLKLKYMKQTVSIFHKTLRPDREKLLL